MGHGVIPTSCKLLTKILCHYVFSVLNAALSRYEKAPCSAIQNLCMCDSYFVWSLLPFGASFDCGIPCTYHLSSQYKNTI